MKLEQLKSRLQTLKRKAKAFDDSKQQMKVRLFDEHLFQSSGFRTLPCVLETESLLNKIVTLSQQSANQSASDALVDKFSCQLEALERVLATIPNNKQNSTQQKSLAELKASLAQHKVWEQKLCQLVRDKEQNQHDEQALIETEQRLQRCRSAMNQIQYTINQRMKFI
ncbi:primosomal replication protein N prime prime [Vibrio maritimus]|uniref:Primosomal replication protein N prime prime n=1 Tax=Vibrio maritimus TaxID=990268 RepID=A0A090T4I2_9VIBR|nr:primosomal replication protein N prime prime [Vibrio maritimus]